MRKLQRVAVTAALAAAALGVAGAAANAATAAPAALAAAALGVAGAAANAATAAPRHSAQEAAASRDGGASVKANERVVEAFLQDVVNEHNGDHAINYMNPDMQWYGGTVGTATSSGTASTSTA